MSYKQLFRLLSSSIIILLILFMLKTYVFRHEVKAYSIEVGQVWEETLYEDNPYKETKTYTKEVIEIKNGYVLYVENSIDTLSESKYWFTVSSECIKK